jgi:hypothetical protein
MAVLGRKKRPVFVSFWLAPADPSAIMARPEEIIKSQISNEEEAHGGQDMR